MITAIPVTIRDLVGTIVVEELNGNKHDAQNEERVEAGEMLIPKKNSACQIEGKGFVIARITKTKTSGGISVRVCHPLARYSNKPAGKLTATALRIGDKLLVVQAQRESASGRETYSLIVKL